MEQDLKSTECVRALVFVCQLETGEPKLLCAPTDCLGAKTNHNSTYIIFFFEPFLVISLQLELRIVDSPSSLVVHFQPS
jgi:hypothetical protein